MDRWIGRVALVTGASAGIGAAVCRALVGHGMIVVGCARKVDKIRALADIVKGPGKLIAIKCDLSVESEILEMFEEIRAQFGRLDVCINNAGLSHDSPLLSGRTQDWRNMLDVNVLALCICTQEAVKLMREKAIDDGQIIHIGSMGGHRPVTAMPGVNFYCGTKSMVVALTESLRMELKAAGLNIRIASISPGFVKTEFLDNYLKDTEDGPRRAAEIYASVESLQGDDIANTLLYILGTPPHVEVHDVLVRPVGQHT